MKTKILLSSLAVLFVAGVNAQNSNLNALAHKWFVQHKNSNLSAKSINGIKTNGSATATYEGGEKGYGKVYVEVTDRKHGFRPRLVPVKIMHFSADCYSDKVVLRWSTEEEDLNDCFIVEKSVNGGTWVKVAMIKGQGNNGETNFYSLSDYNDNSEQVYYRLNKGIYDGHTTYYHIVTGN